VEARRGGRVRLRPARWNSHLAPSPASPSVPLNRTDSSRHPKTSPSSESWKVYALLNHDLAQIYVGALHVPMAQMNAACAAIVTELEDWDTKRHAVECIEALEQFPTERHAKAYALWLSREGAIEGLESYAVGLDAALA
jgi:hypothetical protein